MSDHPHGSQALPDIEDIHLAEVRIRGQARRTPVFTDPGLDEAVGTRLWCKCENLQRTGAFKFRGACNAVAHLREQGIEGDVATDSSGNHGAALALAASLDGRRAHVVMPDNSVPMKIEAVKRYGGTVHFCEPTHQARAAGVARLLEDGLIPVPPYDHPDIIAGQGTAALELLQDVPDLEMLVTPVGGGGLVSGSAIAARDRGVAVFAAEPEGADDTIRSLAQGRRIEAMQADTIADGLRALVGKMTFSIIRDEVKQVLPVSDEEIRSAMRLFWRESRLLIEPSSATVIAAIRKNPEVFGGRHVGAVISGGNLDPAGWLELAG